MADHTNTVDYRSPVYLQMRELIRSRIAEGIYQARRQHPVGERAGGGV